MSKTYFQNTIASKYLRVPWLYQRGGNQDVLDKLWKFAGTIGRQQAILADQVCVAFKKAMYMYLMAVIALANDERRQAMIIEVGGAHSVVPR